MMDCFASLLDKIEKKKKCKYKKNLKIQKKKHSILLVSVF